MDIVLIKNAYNYYDKKISYIEKKLGNISKYKIIGEKSSSDLEPNIINFYDSNNKLIFSTQYEKMGYYNKKTKIWIWAWAFNGLKGFPPQQKNELYLTKKLLNYGLDIELLDNDKSKNPSLLKDILSNSRILISNITSLNLLVYISLYLTKKDYLLTLKVKNNNHITEYLYLFNFKYY